VMPEEPEEPLTADGKLPFVDLNMLRKCAVKQALEMTRGHKSRAAKLLGVHPNTMTRIIAELNRPRNRRLLVNAPQLGASGQTVNAINGATNLSNPCQDDGETPDIS